MLIESLRRTKEEIESDPKFASEVAEQAGEGAVYLTANGDPKQFDCPVYEVSNIYRYLTETNAEMFQDGLGGFNPHLAKNVFPPHDRFWFEIETVTDGLRIIIGQLVTSEKTESGGWAWRALNYAGCPDKPSSIPGLMFCRPVPCALEFATDAEGNVASADSLTLAEYSQQQNDLFVKTATGMLLCTLAALGFLNLHKNSVTVNVNHPSRQQRRAAARSGKKPPPSYMTIMVKGMGKRYAKNGNGNGGGSAYSLHIVKGHRMTGTPLAPLFGKPWGVGTFWVPAHKRGDEKVGDLTKVPKVVKLGDEVKVIP